MKTIGLARLGKDVEVRYLPDGKPVANLSLAVNYGQKQDDGNRKTQWIEASLWGQQAEVLAPYLLRGTVHCFALSDIHIETYQGQNGEGHKLVARVDSVELGPRTDGGQQQAQQPQRQQQPQQRQAPQRQQPQQGSNYRDVRNGAAPPPRQQPSRTAPPMNTGSGFDDMADDEIPY
jgi:single-strand DNA-binding protein